MLRDDDKVSHRNRNRTAHKLAPVGRPVDCLGLTKRWSLYVASTATPGPWLTLLTDLRQAINP